jgi:type II secretory pathway component PulM
VVDFRTFDLFGKHKLKRILKEIMRMSAELDRLTTEVEESRTVTQSAIVLLGKLADLIRASVNDPVKLKQLADDLDAQQKELSDAVVANTPAEG